MENLGKVKNVTKLMGLGIGLGLMSMTMAGCSSGDKDGEDDYKREVPVEVDVIDWLVNEGSLQMITTKSELESRVIEYEGKYPELKDLVSKKSKKYENGTVINFRAKYFEVSYIVDNNGNIVGVTGKHVPISEDKIELDSIDKLDEIEKKKLEELEKDGYGAELEKEEKETKPKKDGLVLPGQEGSEEPEEVEEEVQEDEGEVGTTPDKPEVNTGDISDKENKQEESEQPEEPTEEPTGEEDGEEEDEEGGSLFGLDKLEKGKNSEKDGDSEKDREELIQERIAEETESFNHFVNYVGFGVTLPINITETEFNDHLKDVIEKDNANKLKPSKKERIYPIEEIGRNLANNLFHNYIQDIDGVQVGIGNAIKNDSNLRVSLISILDITKKIDEIEQGEEEEGKDKKSKKDK